MNFLKELRERGLLQELSVPDNELKLAPGDSLYWGVDPTAPYYQLGNLVPLMAILHMARAGLKPLLLFGGATGAIGDPSGRSTERQLLDRATIVANIESQQRKVREIFQRLGLTFDFIDNYEWTKNVSMLDFLRDVGKHFTVNYMIAKDVVKTRLSGEGISYTEFSYMLLQAHDFLHLYQTRNCRLQIGGSDQWGNLTAGLELIRRKLQGEAYALSVPLLLDSEGRKFGKSSAGERIWLDEAGTSPYRFYQFWLNASDVDAVPYLKRFTLKSLDEIAVIAEAAKREPEKRHAQRALADAVCTLVHGEKAAQDARRSAEVLFGGSLDGLKPAEIEEIFRDAPSSAMPAAALKEISIIDLFVETKLAKSKGEARRLIESGGAYLNSERVTDGAVSLAAQTGREIIVLRSGKKNYHIVKVLPG